MNFLELMYEDQISWEKCARLLVINSPNDLNQIISTASTLINNIIKNPEVEKYRTVKCSNAVLHQNLLSKSGGAEFLLCIGFNTAVDVSTGLKTLVFTPKNNFNAKKSNIVPVADIKELEDSMEWLCSTVQDCIELWKLRKLNDSKLTENDSCCECIIQIKLPTGTTVSGGFMKNDLFMDIKLFARSYFHRDR